MGEKCFRSAFQMLAVRREARLGLLISRLPPSLSALRSRRDAYSDEEKLILFLSNDDLRKMIEMRQHGGEPTSFSIVDERQVRITLLM